MCSSDLVASFFQIGYLSEDLFARDETSIVKERTKKQVDDIIAQIFFGQT